MEKSNIFFIDDSELLHLLVKRRIKLTEHNIDIKYYLNAEDALDNLEKYQPTVIFLDDRLDGVFGSEAAPVFKDALPDCKLILISSEDQIALVDKCFRKGADYFISKNNRFFENAVDILTKINFNYSN